MAGSVCVGECQGAREANGTDQPLDRRYSLISQPLP